MAATPCQLKQHADCTACPLHTHAVTKGMATRIATVPVSPKPGAKTALLLVSSNPGRVEDLNSASYSDHAGKMVHSVFLPYLGLDGGTHVYLSYAVRCHTKAPSLTKGQVTACRPHLTEDIAALQAQYDEVVILCVGSDATQAVWGRSLADSLARQGDMTQWGWAGTESLRPCRVYSTFHVANLISKHDPNRAVAMKAHLALLRSYLSGSPTVYREMPEFEMCPEIPNYPIDRLSLDIETYGLIAGEPNQTCFHPAKFRHFDRPRWLIATVSVAWREPDGRIRLGNFQFKNRRHRSRLAGFIRNSRELIGMNFKFDLLCLRAADPIFRVIPEPWRMRITDVGVLNYLYSEQRPERSLKSIAPLLGITRYDEEEVEHNSKYASDEDINLHRYNAKDAWATLLAVEHLERDISKDYPQSAKLSEYSRQWYSDLFWTCLMMEETGVTFDFAKLDELDFQTVLRAALIRSECRYRWDLPIAGKGSGKAVEALFLRAVELANLVGDPRVELTDVTKRVATNKNNCNLLLQTLEPDSLEATQLRLYARHEELDKILTAYTRPMLWGTKKNPVGARLVPSSVLHANRRVTKNMVSIAYPSWFLVPSQHDGGREGGTMQGRITSKGPACQTLPPVVKHCMTTRFDPGFLIAADLSQIELRIAALLSGDPVMMREYQEGRDRHTQTAKLLLDRLIVWMVGRGQPTIEVKGHAYNVSELQKFIAAEKPRQYPEFDVFRQIGKTVNFLVAYGGQAAKLRSTVASDIGVVLPLEVCENLVFVLRNRYTRLAEFQEELIQTAQRFGRLELPLIGQSRVFVGSAKAVRETYHTEILNFPIQTTAANVMLDWQSKVFKALGRRTRPVCLGLNIYDAIYLDGPMSEFGPTHEVLAETFRFLEYYPRLCQYLDREVPLGYDVTVLVKHTVTAGAPT